MSVPRVIVGFEQNDVFHVQFLLVQIALYDCELCNFSIVYLNN